MSAIDHVGVGVLKLVAADTPFKNISPEKKNAPGADGLSQAINGFAYYALLAAAAGFLIGSATWAIGGRIGNDYTATGGKIGMAVAVGVAFLVGSSAVILNFAYNTGSA